MPDLKVKLSFIDEMSDKLQSMAECGQNMADRFESAGNAMSTALDNTVSGASNAISSLDETSSAISSMSNAASSALSSVDNFSDSMNNIGSSVDEASAAADNWTKAAQNYDRSALEAVYSTEQLVEMGYKTADALYTETDIFAQCEQAAGKLNTEMENAANVHTELSSSLEQVNNTMSEYADNSNITSEMQEQLETTSKAAAEAMQELETAQNEAKVAMENYDSVIISGTTDVSALEEAQNMAAQAAENLQSAESNAKKAVEDFSKASDEAGKSIEENSKKGADAFEALADTVIAAKIADTLYDAAKAAYELADAFSEAEKIVVNATGATGEALKGLESSMMSVYASHSQDLATTAGAIGEINTRMGLTGDALESVSGKFLNYSRITNSDVVGSVQNVTKVMNQWGVDMDNVESVLDRLAYAGQISGASVDNLSSTLITGAASFKEVGLSLDNTIQLLADFELAGINSTSALTAMRTAVNNFSKNGLDAQTALQSVIREISTMENSTEATAKAVEVFGSKAGQQLAAAIRNGTVSINSFTSTLEAADGTLAQTANAAETLGEKWDTSTNKMKSAFTTALQPTIDKISSSMATAVGWIGEFLNKHPMVTSAIVGIGAGMAVAAVSVAGFTFTVKVAIPAIAAFGTTLQAALGPIGWISAGATVLVGGIAMLSNAFSKAEDEVADYNGTMEQCANDIRYTEAAYEKACELYGENSKAAKELSENLETLNKQFEKGGGAGAVYVEQAEKLRDSLHEISTAQRQAMEEIDKTETSSLTAVSMLAALSEQSNLTNADLDVMSKYADYLNNEFDCDIKVNYNTKELTGFNPKVLTDAIVEAANNQRVQTALDYLSGAEFQDKYINAKKGVVSLTEEVDKLNRELSDANLPEYQGDRTPKQISEELQKTQQALDENSAALREAENDMFTYGLVVDSTGKFTETFKNTLDEVARSNVDLTESTEKQTRALTENEQGVLAADTAYQQYQEQIERICTAYDEAYQSALESFQGQFGLFDEATNVAEDYEHTVGNVQKALDSQLEYWQTYQSNIETMQTFTADKLGVSQQYYDEFMAYIRTGTPEAAGLIDSMVYNLQNGNEEAVKKMIETKGQITDMQKNTASEVADWETDFSKKMDDVTAKMQETIDGMDLSSEASFAASNTMGAYALMIKESGDHAVATAQNIAQRVSAALSSASGSFNINLSSNVAGHAAGTTNAEDVFIAGENGPELIVGKQGSTVFPTSETNRIISAISGMGDSDLSKDLVSGSSYLTNENYYTTNSSQNTEIVNNYSTIDGGNYDDTRIVSLLESIDTSLSAEVGIDTRYNAPESNVIVDLSVLDSVVSKFRGEEVSNYSDISNAYSNTYNADNSRSYSTAYGDTVSNYDNSVIKHGDLVNNLNNSVIEYGDNVRNLSESINADYSRNTEISTVYGDTVKNIAEDISNIDNSRQYGSTYNADYSRQIEGDTAYGDNIRNAAENIVNADYNRYSEMTTAYGDNVRNAVDSINNTYDKAINEISEHNEIANAYDSTFNADYSRKVNSDTYYGDVVREATSPYSAQNDYNNTNTYHYANTSQKSVQTAYSSAYNTNDYSNAYFVPGDKNETIYSNLDNSVRNYSAGDTSQNFSDSVYSVIMPLPINRHDTIERLVNGAHSTSMSYYNSIENNSNATEFNHADRTFEYKEDSDRIIAADSDRRSYSENSDYSESVERKEIVIRIEGVGEIPVTVNGNMSKEDILETVLEYVRPALVSVISEDILEEGDSSYEW